MILSFIETFGLKIHLIANEELSIKEEVDVYVMYKVIEHIRNVSNRLTVIKRALVHEGFLLLSTPNFLRSSYQQSNPWSTASAFPIRLNFLHKNSCREC